MIIYDGEHINFCQVLLDENEQISTSMSYNAEEGTSWTYYVNSGDYKLNSEDNLIVAYILVAGVDKEEIKASIEDKVLTVTTEKPGWNGVVNVNLDLSGYKVDATKPKIKLKEGVLRIEFPKVDEKIELKIK